MKIIIASTIVPFIEGGGTFIVDWLEQKLREYGHQVDVVKIPFSSNYLEMLSQMTALRLYHLEDACDRLICIRMPSYLIPHPDKYLWFIHHYREVYDLWNTELGISDQFTDAISIREYIMRADSAAFSEAKKIYTNSKIVSKRLMDFNGVNSETLYPPILRPEQFFCDEYGDFIYYTSRICRPKRQFLAVQAMQYTKTKVKLLITGKPDEPVYLEKIYKYIRNHSLQKKVTILDEWITEQQKAEYFAKCLAALYIPYDEDSYGYPSLEAHHSRKAVITCNDSGGTDELIVDGKNGRILEPDPQIIADSFDKLYIDRRIAKEMGDCGYNRISELGITWDNVIGSFTR
jgi:glycosyltransferase involved in cell wall biosynthesis